MVMWWGLYCHPTMRGIFVLLYCGCGAACVWAALHATTAAGRGVPMLGLLALRLTAFATRAVLEPPSVALQHYAVMEVRLQRRPAQRSTAWSKAWSRSHMAAGPGVWLYMLVAAGALSGCPWAILVLVVCLLLVCSSKQHACLYHAGLLPSWRSAQRVAHSGALAAAQRPWLRCPFGLFAQQPSDYAPLSGCGYVAVASGCNSRLPHRQRSAGWH